MPKLTGSTPRYTYLVANLAEGSDPSKGRNPTKLRSVFEKQHFNQIPRAGQVPDSVSSADQPGTGSFTGRVSWAVADTPTAATGTLTVTSNTFTDPVTLYLGEYVITTTTDFAPVATATASGLITINVAALTAGDIISINGNDLTGVGGARTSGLDDFNVGAGSAIALGGELEAAINDASNSFDGDVVATDNGDGTVTLDAVASGVAGNSITLTKTLNTDSDVTLSGGTLTGGADESSTAAALEAVIDSLPGFSASSVGAVITISGPSGPTPLKFEVTGTNYTLSPDRGLLDFGDPVIGPPVIQ